MLIGLIRRTVKRFLEILEAMMYKSRNYSLKSKMDILFRTMTGSVDARKMKPWNLKALNLIEVDLHLDALQVMATKIKTKL